MAFQPSNPAFYPAKTVFHRKINLQHRLLTYLYTGKGCGFFGFFSYTGTIKTLGEICRNIDIYAILREGKQHCQSGTPEFLSETFELARKATDKRLLLRLDSGNNDIGNIRVCHKAKVDFVIKRNMRKESIDEWLLDARALGEWRTPRKGKVVQCVLVFFAGEF
jgi:hypothetical protein